MKSKIEKLQLEMKKEYEENKHRYSSLDHFCDLGIYNLENNTNFQPEEMSHEMIKSIKRKQYEILGILEEK